MIPTTRVALPSGIVRWLLLLALGPISHAAVESRLTLTGGPAVPALWRGRLEAHSPLWHLQMDGRRRDGERGLLPHAAAWLAWTPAPGWRLAWGDQQVGGCWGAALDRPGSAPPTRWGSEPRLGPAGLPSRRPQERGLGLEGRRGAWRGGLLAATTRRDANADGEGFRLDLPHTGDTRRQTGTWRDRLVLGWLAAGDGRDWGGHLLAGARRAPRGGGGLGSAQLSRRMGTLHVGLGAEGGEHRLARLHLRQGSLGRSWQLDAWRGRAGAPVFAVPALPVGDGAWAGGLWLQARAPLGFARTSLSLRWLEEAARTSSRSATEVVWSVGPLPGPPGSGLGWELRHRRAEDRPAGAGREAWRVSLRPRRPGSWEWELRWQEERRSQERLRWWSLAASRRVRWRDVELGVAGECLLGRGDGSGTVVLAPAPGLLRLSSLGGGGQLASLGLWMRHGGHELSVGLVRREHGQAPGEVEGDGVALLCWGWRTPRAERSAP